MVFLSEEDLLGNFIKKYVARKRLFEATFEITSRCNLRCAHCYIDQQNAGCELSIDDWKRIVDILVDSGLCVITLTGGEPLLRGNLIELVRHAFRKGCQVRLFSNGNLFDSLEMVSEFKKAGLCYFETSIYGAKAATHDAITKIHGSFAKTLRAIDYAKTENIAVTVKTVWLKPNWREYLLVLALVKELGVYFRGSPSVMPRLDGDTSNTDLRMPFEDLVAFFKLAAQVTPPRKSTILPDMDKAVCGLARVSVFVMNDGTLCPCNHLRKPVGNILKDDFGVLWRSSPLLTDLRKVVHRDFKQCDGCLYRKFCFVCMGDAWFENDDILKPAAEACLLARARHDAAESSENLVHVEPGCL